MLKRLFISLCILSLSCPCLASDYLWPIKKHSLLSSVFGDYRDFHFHAGVDIRTGGKTGAKVLAPADGYVFRLFTSYRGYGKAAYLKSKDGRIFVFGHLSDFSPEVSKIVQKEQLRNKRYYLNFFPRAIDIKKGELIGYSGESGYGGPHLHFEIRDQENHPLNPLINGFSVSDTISPILEKIALKPADFFSTVNGLHQWMILPFYYDKEEKIYTLEDTLVVDGKLGLALSVFDKMNGSEYKFGIYQIKLYLDGELIFSSGYDSLDFENTHKIDLERKAISKRDKKDRFYKLFLEEGNDLKLYPKKDGTIDTQAEDSLGKKVYQRGYHKIEILALDANFNSAKAEFCLLFDQAPRIKQVSCEESGEGITVKVEPLNKYDVDRVYLLTSGLDSILWKEAFTSQEDEQGIYSFTLSREPQIVGITTENRFGNLSDYKYLMVDQNNIPDTLDDYAPSSVKLDYAFDKGNFIFYLFFDKFILEQPDVWLEAFSLDFNPIFSRRLDNATFYAVIPFNIVNRGIAKLVVEGCGISNKEFRFDFPISIAITTPFTGGEATSLDGKVKVQVDEEGVYEDMNLFIQPMDDVNEDLMKGTFYSIEPQDMPLNKEAKLWLSYPDNIKNPDKLAIYGYNKRGKWEFVGKELDEEQKSIKAGIRYFSIYALGRDTVAPVIKMIRPKPNQRFKNKKPKIVAIIEDNLSGIGDDRDIEIYLDGKWLIPEYDIDNKILQTKPHFNLSQGTHSLTIKVKDRMGNASSIKRKFRVR